MFEEPPWPAGWSLRRLGSSESASGSESEQRLWDDPTGALTIARVGEASAGHYRLRFNHQFDLDVLIYDQLILDRSAVASVPSSTRSHVLYDQLYPRILAQEGYLVLHAGAFAAGNSSILIVGPSGRGKSSLIASFDQAGFTLLGDDALIISQSEEGLCAKAIYPSLRLLPDSLRALYPGPIATADVAHYTSKQRIDVAMSQDSPSEPLPIQAIFVLAEASTDSEIHLTQVSIANSCMSLVENSFALDPTDRQQASKRLEAASALAREVPAFEISYPRDYARLPAVRDAIMAQCARLYP